MGRIAIVAIVISFVCGSAGAVDFTCEFVSRTTLVGLEFLSLKPERKQETERFTFSFPLSACVAWEQTWPGKYYNEIKKWDGEVAVQCADGRATLLEKSNGDNLFVASIFSEGKGWEPGEKYPALFTLHAWIRGIDHYRPYTATGSCQLLRR